MRFKEVRALLKELDEVYNPVSQARRRRQRRPVFGSTEVEETAFVPVGQPRLATQGEIFRAIKRAREQDEENGG